MGMKGATSDNSEDDTHNSQQELRTTACKSQARLKSCMNPKTRFSQTYGAFW